MDPPSYGRGQRRGFEDRGKDISAAQPVHKSVIQRALVLPGEFLYHRPAVEHGVVLYDGTDHPE